jgi:hypothetical protein
MNEMTHHIKPAMAILVILGLTAFMQASDDEAAAADRAVAHEVRVAQHQARQEAREWAHRVSVCHRAFGPNTTPVEDEDGNFRCAGRRLKPTSPDSIHIASKQ